MSTEKLIKPQALKRIKCLQALLQHRWRYRFQGDVRPRTFQEPSLQSILHCLSLFFAPCDSLCAFARNYPCLSCKGTQRREEGLKALRKTRSKDFSLHHVRCTNIPEKYWRCA